MSFHLHPGSAPCPCWVLGALLHPACRWGLKAAFWRHSSAKVLQLINTSARNWKNCMHTAIRTYLYAFRMVCFNKKKNKIKYGFSCCLSWGNKHQGTRSAALLPALCAWGVWAADWQGCTGRRDRDGCQVSPLWTQAQCPNSEVYVWFQWSQALFLYFMGNLLCFIQFRVV